MIIERFNRTLRDRISKFQSFHKQKNYVDELQNLVNQYNNTEHSSIKMTPKQAKDQSFSNNEARQQKLDVNQIIDQTFKIGDFVRVLRNKKLFEKGQKNYTKNVYKIIGKEDNNFILKKFKDGKLLDKELKKTAQYLMKVNVFELIENMKKKKEINKKEVKQQTNFEKKLKREGINLRNIIEYEKYLDEIQPTEANNPNNSSLGILFQQNQKQLNQEKNKNKLLRSKSQEDLEKYKEQFQKQDEEIIKKDEELNKTKVQKKIKENEAKVNKYKLLIKDNNVDAEDAKIEQKQKLFKLMKNYDVNDIIKFYQNNKDKNFFKDVNMNLDNNDIEEIKKFLKLKSVQDKDFKKPKNSGKDQISLYTFYLEKFQQMSLTYFDNQINILEKENKKLLKQDSQSSDDEEESKDQQSDDDEQEDFIDKQLEQQNISDSDYFKQNELQNYNTAEQINQKIQELQQAIDLMQDDDDIDMLIRVAEYNNMIKILKQKLQQIKQQKPENIHQKFNKIGKK
ncbi:hypothetical protein ABPG74_003757 [Tetrahymena malaccensis]